MVPIIDLTKDEDEHKDKRHRKKSVRSMKLSCLKALPRIRLHFQTNFEPGPLQRLQNEIRLDVAVTPLPLEANRNAVDAPHVENSVEAPLPGNAVDVPLLTDNTPQRKEPTTDQQWAEKFNLIDCSVDLSEDQQKINRPNAVVTQIRTVRLSFGTTLDLSLNKGNNDRKEKKSFMCNYYYSDSDSDSNLSNLFIPRIVYRKKKKKSKEKKTSNKTKRDDENMENRKPTPIIYHTRSSVRKVSKESFLVKDRGDKNNVVKDRGDKYNVVKDRGDKNNGGKDRGDKNNVSHGSDSTPFIPLRCSKRQKKKKSYKEYY